MIQIGGLQKLTLIDYPGRLAATVFLCGCNFRCPWCYSRELVLPEEIKKQPRISEKDFFDFLKERKGLLEALVLCGGEPSINQDLPQFCKKIKKLGYLVKLDTNGSNPKMLKDLIDKKLVDYVAMDIKAPLKMQSAKCKTQNDNSKFKNKYERATGIKINLEDIKKSIKIIKNSGIEYEFRTTVVPSIHTKEDIIQIAREISPAKRYYLQNFRPQKTIDPSFEKIKPYPREYLLEIQKAISPFFEICQVR
jgi:pyruvate formate lyase activating enzyme